MGVLSVQLLDYILVHGSPASAGTPGASANLQQRVPPWADPSSWTTRLGSQTSKSVRYTLSYSFWDSGEPVIIGVYAIIAALAT
jgi:hypothetical protein